ncbi:hypothetical protein [Nostoc sp.]|uniref:hypothetical protein n=1 Tax=Nostoc sp. TaxID=1180 RepID=UPI002FFA3B8A
MVCHFLKLDLDPDLDPQLLQEVGDLGILMYSALGLLYLNKYELQLKRRGLSKWKKSSLGLV